jgi:hypothetical protein
VLVMPAMTTIGAEILPVYMTVIDPCNHPFNAKILVYPGLNVFFKAFDTEVRRRQLRARGAKKSSCWSPGKRRARSLDDLGVSSCYAA